MAMKCLGHVRQEFIYTKQIRERFNVNERRAS